MTHRNKPLFFTLKLMSLFVVVVSVIYMILVIFANPKFETGFIELYFVEPKSLPKQIALHQDYSILIGIENKQDNAQRVSYSWYIGEKLFQKEQVDLQSLEKVTITQNLRLASGSGNEVKISVILGSGEEIHFWSYIQ